MYSDQQANAGLFAPGDGVDIHEQSPLNLAFVGDGVWELLVRQRLVERTRLQPGRLHSEAVKYVSAKAQFQALALLTEQEQAVVRRGKNTSKATVAKHATPEEYRASTGFEALLGWLFLQGRGERIRELFETVWQAGEAEKE